MARQEVGERWRSFLRSSRPLLLNPSCLGSFDTILTMVKYDVTRVNEGMTLALTVGMASPFSKMLALLFLAIKSMRSECIVAIKT